MLGIGMDMSAAANTFRRKAREASRMWWWGSTKTMLSALLHVGMGIRAPSIVKSRIYTNG